MISALESEPRRIFSWEIEFDSKIRTKLWILRSILED
jgi:hypothetical protein